jgi:outer membrane receptor for ferrienterochelin and colicins
MRHSTGLFAMTLLGTSAFASFAGADDAELEGLLDQTVLTTASKASEVGSTAPGTSMVITAEDIRRYGIHTVAEAIDFLAIGAAGGEQLGARGVHIEGDFNEHFLLLIDGHAVNSPMIGGAPLGVDVGVPLELVDHIELVLGPGSVLYGSNAMLGVINVITKRAKNFHGTRVGVESYLPYGVRAWTGAGYELELLGAPSEITVGLQYQRTDGPNPYFTPQNTGVDPVTGRLARYSDDPNGTGIWGGQSTHSALAEAPSAFARLIVGNFEVSARASSAKANTDLSFAHFDEPVNRTISRRLAFEVKHHALLSSVVQVSTRLYADHADSQTTFHSSLGGICPIATNGTCAYVNLEAGRWAGVEIQTTFDWQKDGTLVTLLGVDPRVRSGQGKLDTLDASTGAPITNSFGIIDRTDATLGAYIQQTWRPIAPLGLNAGLRVDADPRFEAEGSPRLAATANVWRGGVLKVMYSEAFRAPSFHESYFTHPLQAAGSVKEESVSSMEASIEQKFGAQRLLFGAFKSTWTDLIHLHFFTPAEAAELVRSGQANLPPVSQYQNIDRIENFGLNTGLDGSLADATVRYGATLTAAIARTGSSTSEAVPLTASPRMFGNARVSYVLPGQLPTVGLATHFASAAPIEGAYAWGSRTIPYAPPQLALRATLTGDVPLAKGLSYRVSADYQFANRADEVVGPITEATPSSPTPNLRPIAQFTSMIGLQYEIDR